MHKKTRVEAGRPSKKLLSRQEVIVAWIKALVIDAMRSGHVLYIF